MDYRIVLTPGLMEGGALMKTAQDVDEVLRVLKVAKLHLQTKPTADPYVWIDPFEHYPQATS